MDRSQDKMAGTSSSAKRRSVTVTDSGSPVLSLLAIEQDGQIAPSISACGEASAALSVLADACGIPKSPVERARATPTVTRIEPIKSARPDRYKCIGRSASQGSFWLDKLKGSASSIDNLLLPSGSGQSLGLKSSGAAGIAARRSYSDYSRDFPTINSVLEFACSTSASGGLQGHGEPFGMAPELHPNSPSAAFPCSFSSSGPLQINPIFYGVTETAAGSLAHLRQASNSDGQAKEDTPICVSRQPDVHRIVHQPSFLQALTGCSSIFGRSSRAALLLSPATSAQELNRAMPLVIGRQRGNAAARFFSKLFRAKERRALLIE